MARMTRMTRMARTVARVARWLADLVDPKLSQNNGQTESDRYFENIAFASLKSSK